jgi:Holliday junction resolvase RusA-like endonuclease
MAEIITIHGQVPSQKNSKSVGVNPRTGRVFVTSNKIVKTWQKEALTQLQAYRGQADGELFITMAFYNKDRRGRDIDNQASSVLDILVKSGLIPDDNCFVVSRMCLMFGGIDKENPRVEITIDESKD